MEPGEKQARSSNGSAPLAPEEAAPAAARATGAFAFASSLVKTREPVGKDTISPPSPDQPLEPGSGVPPGLAISPAERIAASEAALGAAKPPKPAEPEGRANFIAAARRAAQAAAAEAADANKAGANDEKTRKRRVTLLGAGAIVLLAGSAQLAYNVFGDSSTLLGWSKGNVKETSAPNKPAVSKPAQTAASGPKLSPTTSGSASPPERPQMSLVQATDPVAFAAPAAGVLSIAAAHDVAPVPNAVPVATVSIHPTEVTGSAAKSPVTAALPELTIEPASPGDDGLPESIGGPRLKAAAQANDPAAQYEIAVRYAEGRNVRPSLEEAARWFERAANQGLAPAQYRLGSLYEKGRGVKKDLTIARRLYQAAADKGNGKAMHNLAVLHADGVDGKPDYKTAVQWFRKAAARGVVDSQYNLGILYARGIGVEQSLAESYKWFMLAAQQGDPDAGRKRDDVAVRLDPQSLVAAKLAAQTFTPEPQPPEAVAVKAPSGGWDRVGAAPAGAPPKTKGTGSKKTAS
jgi:localization factor PodJL